MNHWKTLHSKFAKPELPLHWIWTLSGCPPNLELMPKPQMRQKHQYLFSSQLKKSKFLSNFRLASKMSGKREKMRQEKQKPLACDILLSAGISITDRCSMSPSPLNDPSSNHSRNYFSAPLATGRTGGRQCFQPVNSSLFPLPLWQIRGCGKGSCLAPGFAPARREVGGRPTPSLFCEAAHKDSFLLLLFCVRFVPPDPL